MSADSVNNAIPAAPAERDPRLCTHPGKDGTGCKGYKVGGEEMCAGHLGRGIAGDPAAYASRGAQASAVVRQERAAERKKTLLDRLAEALEHDAEEIIAAYRLGVKTEGWRGAEAWVARVHGKPEQKTTTEDLTTKRADELTLADLETLRGQLVGDSNVTQLRNTA